MNDARGCDRCREHDRTVLEQIGDTEFNEYLGGKATEEVRRFRCTNCGTSWQHISERGAGGRGSFWSKIDGCHD